MKHSSITKYNRFLIGGILLYVIPILFISLIVVNSIDFDEPKGPYDPNKGIVEPTFDSIPTEVKKEPKKKLKNLSKPKELSLVTQSIIPTQTIENVPIKDSIN
jgi:hypothetical protein